MTYKFGLTGPSDRLRKAELEIQRLHRLLAEKPTENEDSPDDELDPADDSPTKKSKKKPIKKAADEEDDQGEPADDDAPKPDDEPDRKPAKPVENDDRQRKDAAYWSYAFASAKSASPEAILNGVRWRGVVPPEGSAMRQDDYQRFVATSAAMILHVARTARGEDAGPPHRSPEVGDDAYRSDANYRRHVDGAVAAVVKAHNELHGRKLVPTT